ncbi:MAG: hypothetical protein M3024_07250, partial [Candidatus Dormibacteraeota bacterium]|nr:hypothetical protein [Candidatus Dormibacteraeota bacterium]
MVGAAQFQGRMWVLQAPIPHLPLPAVLDFEDLDLGERVAIALGVMACLAELEAAKVALGGVAARHVGLDGAGQVMLTSPWRRAAGGGAAALRESAPLLAEALGMGASTGPQLTVAEREVPGLAAVVRGLHRGSERRAADALVAIREAAGIFGRQIVIVASRGRLADRVRAALGDPE